MVRNVKRPRGNPFITHYKKIFFNPWFIVRFLGVFYCLRDRYNIFASKWFESAVCVQRDRKIVCLVSQSADPNQISKEQPVLDSMCWIGFYYMMIYDNDTITLYHFIPQFICHL